MPEDSYSHLTACSFSHTLMATLREQGKVSFLEKQSHRDQGSPNCCYPQWVQAFTEEREKYIFLEYRPARGKKLVERAPGESTGPLQWKRTGIPDDPLVALAGHRMTKVTGSCAAAIAAPGARGRGDQMLRCPFLSPKAPLIPYSGQG